MTATTDDRNGTTSREQQARERRARARVSMPEPRSVFGRLMAWYSRRTYGDVLDNGLALLHNPRVLISVLRFEKSVEKWGRLDPGLKTLAEMATAARIGCSWCMDFGFFVTHSRGLDTSKLEEVPRWRDSAAFTDRERRVLEYAEAMTATPPEVSDELAAALRDDLGEPAFVELTMIVALENERSRFNTALGLTSQGFKDQCELRR
jgi:alkylhydroperoxidase family enzyme